jgi:hypothetical protein
MAAARLFIVLGIVVLALAMLAVAGYAANEFMTAMPLSCGDYGSPTIAPAECHKTNVVIYVAAFIILGSGIGFLWRKLGG